MILGNGIMQVVAVLTFEKSGRLWTVTDEDGIRL
jgi:hypothetical protein